jgi:hypothetical protein
MHRSSKLGVIGDIALPIPDEEDPQEEMLPTLSRRELPNAPLR